MAFRKAKEGVRSAALKTKRPRRSQQDHRSRKPQKPIEKKTQVRKTPKDTLRIAVVGGNEEVGRNMTMVEYNDTIILIDMGLQFPEEDMPGIDYIINDMSYFKGKERNIKGVIITHAHYDHIGGIPHLMGKIGNPPMFTGDLSAGIIKKRQEQFKTAPKLKISIVHEKSKIKLGDFTIEFFQVNHNIPNSFAAVIHTPCGTVIHTGDFKIDKTPINDKPIDLELLKQIGKKGVLALLADSTNASQPGQQISESEVTHELEGIFKDAPGRIIIGTFASNLNRIQQIVQIAEMNNRKVILEGRSIQNNVEIAHQLGYMKFKSGTLLESQEYAKKKWPDNKIVIIGTGAQGERNAVLMRIANDEHRYLHFKNTDTVIFSSSVIPGNERTVQYLKDLLYRKECTVYHYQMMDVHAGGHAKQEDLALTISLLNPKYLIPIEGNHSFLQIHKQVGIKAGMKPEHCFVADNGQIIEFDKNGNGKLTQDKIPAEYVFVDGLGVGDVSNIVLRDRRVMAQDGMLVIIATIRGKSGELVGNPDIISRGFVYMKENKELIESTRRKVRKICEDHDSKTPAFDDHIKNKIRDDIGEYLWNQTKRRPMILPVVIKV